MSTPAPAAIEPHPGVRTEACGRGQRHHMITLGSVPGTTQTKILLPGSGNWTHSLPTLLQRRLFHSETLSPHPPPKKG